MANAKIYQLNFDGGEDPVLAPDLPDSVDEGAADPADLFDQLDQLALALGDLSGVELRRAAGSAFYDDAGQLRCRRLRSITA